MAPRPRPLPLKPPRPLGLDPLLVFGGLLGRNASILSVQPVVSRPSVKYEAYNSALKLELVSS